MFYQFIIESFTQLVSFSNFETKMPGTSITICYYSILALSEPKIRLSKYIEYTT